MPAVFTWSAWRPRGQSRENHQQKECKRDGRNPSSQMTGNNSEDEIIVSTASVPILLVGEALSVDKAGDSKTLRYPIA